MGSQRPTPKRLAQKLLEIRQKLNLSQNGLIHQMELEETLSREKISAYERGERVPSLSVLLQYARVAGVWVDVLIDDELDLPTKLPSLPKHEGISRKPISKKTLKPS
jgi:transcriptional regulator with XRE-family HTH domain